jgi:hypothetical protein
MVVVVDVYYSPDLLLQPDGAVHGFLSKVSQTSYFQKGSQLRAFFV